MNEGIHISVFEISLTSSLLQKTGVPFQSKLCNSQMHHNKKYYMHFLLLGLEESLDYRNKCLFLSHGLYERSPVWFTFGFMLSASQIYTWFRCIV